MRSWTGRGSVAKRVFDLVLAAIALIVLAPIILIGAIGVFLSSPGPIFFRTTRVGRGGELFTMFKLRTMRVAMLESNSAITAARDSRVFPFGWILRRTKIDELPQLLNILRGDMSIIGPRPEDPRLVREHYSPMHFETLRLKPGLASPGSLWHDAHCHDVINEADAEGQYLRDILPLKLALDQVYVAKASVLYDIRLVARTIGVIFARLAGRQQFVQPPELEEAQQILVPCRMPEGQRHFKLSVNSTSSSRLRTMHRYPRGTRVVARARNLRTQGGSGR